MDVRKIQKENGLDQCPAKSSGGSCFSNNLDYDD